MRMTTAGGEPPPADVSGFVIGLNLLLGDDRNLLSGFIFTEPVQAYRYAIYHRNNSSHQTFTFLSSLEFFLTL